MSFKALYRGRIGGAVAALFCAVMYLVGHVGIALAGFGIVALVGGIIGYRINSGTLPARCDLCGTSGVFGAEYGHGFQNARLILSCPRCGRVVNRPGYGVSVDKDRDEIS